MANARLHILMAVLALCCAMTAGAGGRTEVQARDKSPVWTTDLAVVYPPARYLAAVGTGGSRRDAEADAAAALARQFKITIRADTVSRRRYVDFSRGTQGTSDSEESYSNTITSQTDLPLINLQYSDPYVDSQGRTSVVAYLDRPATAGIYRSLVQNEADKARRLKDRALALPTALPRFALYDAAVHRGLNAEQLLATLRILDPATAAALSGEADQSDAAQLRDTEAIRLRYRLSVDGPGVEKLVPAIQKALLTLGLVQKDEGGLLAAGSWLVEPVAFNPAYRSVKWQFSVALTDESKATIAAVSLDGRESALTDADAYALALKEIEKRLPEALVQGVNDYLIRVTQD